MAAVAPAQTSTATGGSRAYSQLAEDMMEEIAASKRLLEAFSRGQIARFEDLRRTHAANTAAHAEAKASLEAEESALGERATQFSADLEARREELEAVEGELSDLNTAVAAAQAEVERMSSVVGDEEKRFTQFRMQVEEEARAKEERVACVTTGVEWYKERLGLRFERIDGNLRFIFSNIDAEDTSREFIFSVLVDENDQYTMTECVPKVPGIKRLIADLNSSNNFSGFVKAMRNKFKVAAGH